MFSLFHKFSNRSLRWQDLLILLLFAYIFIDAFYDWARNISQQEEKLRKERAMSWRLSLGMATLEPSYDQLQYDEHRESLATKSK